MDDNAIDITSRLDRIFRLLAIVATKDLKQRERITLFNRVGLSPKEIAELLGTSSNTVRVELVSIRKEKTKRSKR